MVLCYVHLVRLDVTLTVTDSLLCSPFRCSLQTSGQIVERRYKHFDWLHDRMVEKFTLLSVPPLPDKQYAGEGHIGIMGDFCPEINLL